MAAEEAASGEGETQAVPKRKISLQAIIMLANTLIMLVGLGSLVYFKLLYQRPAITEEEEIQKEKEALKQPDPAPLERPMVGFDPVTVNIAMTSGKVHYASVQFSLECKNQEVESILSQRKPLFLDRFINHLGKRQVSELNTIQGKLLFKTTLIREFNQMIVDNGGPSGGITDMFFSTFMLQ